MLPLLPIALSLAGQFAPEIIKHFGGGATAEVVAGQVIDIAKTVTGQDTAENAAAALQADPAAALRFRSDVLAADVDLEKAYLGDRQNARDRDVKMRQAGQNNRRADYMVLLDVIGLVACLAVLALFRADMPGEVVALLSSIASIFGLCLRDAHQFEFGSSRGSKEKDAALSGLGK